MSFLSTLLDAAEAEAAARVTTPTTTAPAPEPASVTTDDGDGSPVVFLSIDPEEASAAALVTAMYAEGFGVSGQREWQSTDGVGYQGHLTRTVPGKKRPVKVAWFHDHGQGGMVELSYERNGNGDMARMAVNKIKADHPEWTFLPWRREGGGTNEPFTARTDDDLLIGAFSAEHQARAKCRRHCRQAICFVRPSDPVGTYMRMQTADTPAVRTKIANDHPGAVILNDQPWAKK